MDTKAEVKLKQVLSSNPDHPLLLIGANGFKFENYVELSASIDERELHIPTNWHKLLEKKAQKTKVYLIIKGLEQLEEQKQEKFAGLLKDHRAGGYKLPANVQIIIPVAEKDKISKKIQSISLLWKIK